MVGVFAAVVLFAAAVSVSAGLGMRVQPGGALIQHVPVGKRIELPAPLVIFNDADEAHMVSISACKPSAIGARPPHGYREIPDVSWLSFSLPEVEIGPRGQAASKMFLTVPEDEAYLNQHWSVSLAVRSAAAKGQRIGLAVYPRYEIETAAGERSVRPAGDLVLTPSVLRFEDTRPGAPARVLQLRVWNNTAKPRRYKVLILGKPKEEQKPLVRLSYGWSWIPDTSWVTPGSVTLVVAAESSVELPVRIGLPDAAEYYGGAWEAVLVLTCEKETEAFARIRVTTPTK